MEGAILAAEQAVADREADVQQAATAGHVALAEACRALARAGGAARPGLICSIDARVENGKAVEQFQMVSVQAGGQAHVNFPQPLADAPPARSAD